MDEKEKNNSGVKLPPIPEEARAEDVEEVVVAGEPAPKAKAEKEKAEAKKKKSKVIDVPMVLVLLMLILVALLVVNYFVDFTGITLTTTPTPATSPTPAKPAFVHSFMLSECMKELSKVEIQPHSLAEAKEICQKVLE